MPDYYCSVTVFYAGSMRSMRSMRGGFIFRNAGVLAEGTSRPVSHKPRSMTKYDAGGSPPRAECGGAKPPHDKLC